MKITIDTNVLKQYNLSLQGFLTLLLGYYDVDVGLMQTVLHEKGLVDPHVLKQGNIVLSDNTKNLVAKILTESNEEVVRSGIDFIQVANKLIACYPTGLKPGTTYSWTSDIDTIAQKLRTLVVKYNFLFTEEEAVTATKEYVQSFEDRTKMKLLRNFLLCTTHNNDGSVNMSSDFMSIIEYHRDNKTKQ